MIQVEMRLITALLLLPVYLLPRHRLVKALLLDNLLIHRSHHLLHLLLQLILSLRLRLLLALHLILHLSHLLLRRRRRQLSPLLLLVEVLLLEARLNHPHR